MKILLITVISLLTIPAFLNSTLAKTPSPIETFKDSAYTQATTSFLPGQRIYIRVKSENLGTSTKQLKILDNHYQLIKTYQLIKIVTLEPVYTVNFLLPKDAGIYSLEATISSNGSVDKFVRTITVGDGSQEKIKVNINNEVNNNNGKEIVKVEKGSAGSAYVVSTPSSQTPSSDQTYIADNPDIFIFDKPKTVGQIVDLIINFITNSLANIF